jgi:hypothetical protein
MLVGLFASPGTRRQQYQAKNQCKQYGYALFHGRSLFIALANVLAATQV